MTSKWIPDVEDIDYSLDPRKVDFSQTENERQYFIKSIINRSRNIKKDEIEYMMRILQFNFVEAQINRGKKLHDQKWWGIDSKNLQIYKGDPLNSLFEFQEIGWLAYEIKENESTRVAK